MHFCQILKILNHTIAIALFVFSMMIIIDFLNVLTKNRLNFKLSKNKTSQYILSSLLGASPGCLGAFMVDSMYIHGFVSFGAIVGTMIATSGDEQFVMLIKFPKTALLLFILLFVAGIIFGFITDVIIKKGKIRTCENCEIAHFHKEDINQFIEDLKNPLKWVMSYSFIKILFLLIFAALIILNLHNILGPNEVVARYVFITLNAIVFVITLITNEHYVREHIYEHILKSHLIRIFLWTFGVLLVLDIGKHYFNLDSIVKENLFILLLLSALIGIIPESGPHLFFVMLYSQGQIPFSILFTSSFIQDGHGLLPLFSYNVRDVILIKVFNLVYGLTIGIILFILGL